MSDENLPEAFESLKPLLKDWGLSSTAERMAKRRTSSMGEIRAFYDTVYPQLDDALAYLDDIPYGRDMSDQDRNLLSLCLSLAEITTAVEWYGQPGVVDGYASEALIFNKELP